MSSPKLREIATTILNNRYLYKEGGEKDVRKTLQRLPGQLVIIKEDTFKKTLISSVPMLENNSKSLNNIWIEFKTVCIAHEQKAISSGIGKLNMSAALQIYETKLNLIKNGKLNVGSNDIAIVVSSFDSFQSGYIRKKQKSIVENELKKILKTDTLSAGILAQTATLAGAGSKLGGQLGHGAIGAPTSSVRAAIATTSALNMASREDIAKIQTIQAEYEKELKLTITHDQLVDSDGNFLKEYIPILEWQSSVENQEDKKKEEKAIQNYFNKWTEISTAESSLSLYEAIERVLFYNIAGKPQKNKKVIGIKAKKVKSKTKATAKRKEKIKSKINVVSSSGVLDKPKTTKIKTNNLFSLLALINAKLPETVAKNMGDPALNNVTGRFAMSVRATDIGVTSQGFPSIGYTYNDIYRTFEVGNKQGSTERDPRRLVDSSIREIASQMAIGRFYTRRV